MVLFQGPGPQPLPNSMMTFVPAESEWCTDSHQTYQNRKPTPTEETAATTGN